MPWIESHTELRDHPKTKRLARLLDCSIAQAVGHLHLLWWWVMDYAPDGNLSGYSVEDLADAGGWEGDPALFVGSLVDCRVRRAAGFLERDEQGELHVHNWWKYGGKLYEERERRAVHAKEMRQARKGHVPRTSPSREDKAPSRDPLEDMRVHDMTGEESTGEDKTGQEISSAKAGADAPSERKARPKSSSKEPDSVRQPDRKRREGLFSAFVRGQGWNPDRLSTNDRGQINYAIKTLESARASPEEIDFAYERWPKVMRDCVVTPPAVAKHFSTLIAAGRDPTNGASHITGGLSGPYATDEGKLNSEALPQMKPDHPPVSTTPRTPEEALARYEQLARINGKPWGGHDA